MKSMKKRKAKEGIRPREADSKSRIIISSCIGAAIAILCFLVLAFICCAVCMNMSNPHAALTPMCFVCVYAASLAGGFLAVLFNKRSDALICGTMCGAMLLLLLWAALAIFEKALGSTSSIPLSLVWKILILPLSVIGAFAALGQSHRRKKRKF